MYSRQFSNLPNLPSNSSINWSQNIGTVYSIEIPLDKYYGFSSFLTFLFYVFRADGEKADDSIEKVKEALFNVK